MLDMLARTWWTSLFRGIALVIFGAIALLWPGLTLVALIYTYAVFALVDGAFSLASLVARTGIGPWWAQLFGGLLSVAAGVVALVLPGLTVLTFLYLIAAWAVLRGFMDIVVAVALRKEISNEWSLILAGVVSIVFGVVLAVWPGAGLVTFVGLIAVFALVAGVALIALAFRLKGANDRREQARRARA
ncbi:MAG: HdeD family acid-resistance protein [Trueperaceae bacterium]|nr:HdeD family acid-resistance protein [Trueperaceae bacterium]MCW5818876.1 HdeD family acid-resistance protein [Trueperaceae bacterium]